MFLVEHYKKILITLLLKINKSLIKKPGQDLELLSFCCRRLLQQLQSNISLALLIPKKSLQEFPHPILNSLAANLTQAFLAPKQPQKLLLNNLGFPLNRAILTLKAQYHCRLSLTKATDSN